jgi:hypothetical protein
MLSRPWTDVKPKEHKISPHPLYCMRNDLQPWSFSGAFFAGNFVHGIPSCFIQDTDEYFTIAPRGAVTGAVGHAEEYTASSEL